MSFLGTPFFLIILIRIPISFFFYIRGGAEQFIPGKGSHNGTDYYKAFQTEGYNVVYNNAQLQTTGNKAKTLGIFSGT